MKKENEMKRLTQEKEQKLEAETMKADAAIQEAYDMVKETEIGYRVFVSEASNDEEANRTISHSSQISRICF